MITIEFEDQGQDFLEWDISGHTVVGCRPYRASAWLGSLVINVNGIAPGHCVWIRPNQGEPMRVNYPIIKVTEHVDNWSKPDKAPGTGLNENSAVLPLGSKQNESADIRRGLAWLPAGFLELALSENRAYLADTAPAETEEDAFAELDEHYGAWIEMQEDDSGAAAKVVQLAIVAAAILRTAKLLMVQCTPEQIKALQSEVPQ